MEQKYTTDAPIDMNEIEFVGDVNSALANLSYDLVLRNDYINERDRAVYDTGLFEGIDFPDGFDKTLYNWSARVIDIHAAQVMGRGFDLYSSYDKEDVSIIQDPNEQAMAQLRNKKLKFNADARKKAVEAIIRDNGGYGTFHLGAKIGSASGFTVLKEWFDKDKLKTQIKVLESVQNYYAGWDGDDFRTRDFDAFVHQISYDRAMREYGDMLPEGQSFEWSILGNPLGNNKTNDPINQTTSSGTDMPVQTERHMVTVIDITGYIPKWTAGGKGYAKIGKDNRQKRLSCMIVGGHVVQTITDEDLMPDYYIVPNKIEQRRAWGASDLNKSALDINRTFIEVMSTDITLFHKEIAPTYLAKGFLAGGIPPRKRKTVNMIPATADQSIDMIQGRNGTENETAQKIESLKEEFVRATAVGMVMFNDPTVNAGSNQALLTTMKPIIDVTEEKQARWGITLAELFSRALTKASKYVKELKPIIEDENWFFRIEWPSVLRKEDQSYRQMWLNDFHAGVLSWESYLQKVGVFDTSEEMDRLRDEASDPTSAAVLGHQLAELATHTINKSLGIPPWGYVIPRVQLRGELPPQEVGNMGHNFGWDQGPYGDHIGPTGMDGQIASDNYLNAGMTNGDVRDGGAATYPGPPSASGQGQQQAPGPQLTSDQNTGQTASQPGSGAPAVSAGGAISQINQRRGK